MWRGDASRRAGARGPDAADGRRLWEIVIFALTLSKRDARERALAHLMKLVYLSVAPAEALRVADEFGLRARLFADRERIGAAMEHPDVIALAVKSIVDEGPGADDWIETLAEAALQHELVARLLSEEAGVPAWLRERASAVHRSHAWFQAGPAAGSLYGAVLAVAVGLARPPREAGSARLISLVELVSLVDASERRPPKPC